MSCYDFQMQPDSQTSETNYNVEPDSQKKSYVVLGLASVILLILGFALGTHFAVSWNQQLTLSDAPKETEVRTTAVDADREQETINTQKTADLTCYSNNEYLIVERASYFTEGSDIIVKYKQSPGDARLCDHTIEDGDFAIEATSGLFGPENHWHSNVIGNYLLLTAGVNAPTPRKLQIYDLDTRALMYTATATGERMWDDFTYYEQQELTTTGNNWVYSEAAPSVGFWQPIDEEVTLENCPELPKIDSAATYELEKRVELDLETFELSRSGEKRCAYRI